MKTTLDLPDDLVREIKLRALNEGRKLKDTAADLLRRGLKARLPRRVASRSRVRLPLIRCRHSAELTPERVAALLLEQDTAWHHDASGH